MEQYIFAILLGAAAILALLSLFKKWTYSIYYCITALFIAACVFGISKSKNSALSYTEADDLRQNIYVAASLLESDRVADAYNASMAAGENSSNNPDVLLLQALTMNLTGDYKNSNAVLTELNDEKYKEKTDLISLDNSDKAAVSSDDYKSIAGEIISGLNVSDEEKTKWEMLRDLRYEPDLGDDDSDHDTSSLSGRDLLMADVKSAEKSHDWSSAYQITKDMAAEGNFKAQIMMSEMFVKDYVPHDFAKEDIEIDSILKKITDLQVELDELSLSAESSSDSEEKELKNKEYELKKTEYEMTKKELEFAQENRGVNYLRNITPDANGTYAYHIQLARLLSHAGRDDEFKNELDNVFLSNNFNRDYWLGTECMILADKYHEYFNDYAKKDEFESSVKMLLQALTGNLTSNDEVFKDALEKYLKDLYTGVRITDIKTINYPEIHAVISYARDSELTKEDIRVTDTGDAQSDFTLSKRENAEELSVSIVLDRSGSMEGQKLVTAKNAIKRFVESIDTGINLSFVVFDSDAVIVTPLTDSKDIISSSVNSIYTQGGTNIGSGINRALQTLQGVSGRHVIVLLSDGYNSNEDALLDKSIDQAIMDNTEIFTIGMEGADEKTLSDIANRTGGIYSSATRPGELEQVYAFIQKDITNTYDLNFTVKENGDSDRYVTVEMINVPSYDTEEYYIGLPKVIDSSVFDDVASNYYREVGGNGGNRR
ncbi:vWA domain-containing protein [Oribacterium sp. FC2011]|uniref:vWA domain-containing protein n=1 Tax=Oribacterium sp. FC2011 TaxID=1408311 RepID=UPI0004E17267|nr:vWA domain-containing protein [Oribacterium sp. FC2011]